MHLLCHTYNRLRGFLARNQTHQDAFDGVKLCGVYERVDAEVDVCHDYYNVHGVFVGPGSRNVIQEPVNVRRCPGNGLLVSCT